VCPQVFAILANRKFYHAVITHNISVHGAGKCPQTANSGLGFLIFPVNVLPVPNQHAIGTVLIYCSLALALWSGAVYAYRLREVFLETAR